MAKKLGNWDKKTTKTAAKDAIISFMKSRGYTQEHQLFARPSQLGYAAFPDYDMTPQGAAFSVQRLLREMVTDEVIEWVSQGKNESGYWLI
ncbi:hypothetical protein ABXZ88_003238 [Vibrio fluvialis]